MPPLPLITTPNYGFTLPSVGGDANVWGGLLNANWASADTLFKSLADGLAAVTDIVISATAPNPANVKDGDFWLDTSSIPRLKVSSAAVWVLAAPVQTPPVAIASVAPASPVDGDLWYDTTAPAGLFLRVSAAWVRLTGEVPVQEVPVGSFTWHTGRTVPAGYILADGAALTTAVSANVPLRNLYLADGSPYGVSGANPLLPNLIAAGGRFIRGNSGAGVGVAQSDAFQDHGHRITRQTGGGSGGSGEWIGVNDVPGNTTRDNRVTLPVTTGGGSPRTSTETRPVNIALLPCVKL
jgi:hypothetical protein